LPQGVAVFDADMRLVHANKRWAELVAPAASPAPGAEIADALSDGDLRAAALRCRNERAPVRVGGRPVPGAERRLDVTFAPVIENDAIVGVIAVLDDATARVLAERAEADTARLAAFRAEVSQALASSDEVDAVLQACAEAMVRHAPAAFGRIWVLDAAEDVYKLRASAGLYTRLDGTYSRIPADWIRERTFSAHSPAIATDILRTHRVRDPAWAAEQGLVAWASHPLSIRGQVIGFMAMFARQHFDDATLAELAAVADAIAQFVERAQAEAALREREALFRGVFESAADGLVISDLESGQVLEANPAVRRMHGYAPEEFARLNRADLVHPGAEPLLRDYVARIEAGEAGRIRLPHRRRDGSTFPASAQGSLIVYHGRPAVLGVIRDVTEEQRAQERLEQRVAERTRDLSLLLDLSGSIASTLELRPLLELILDRLRAVIAYTGAAILTIEGDELAIARQRGPLSEEAARGIRYPLAGLAPVWDRLSRGEAIFIPDVRGAAPEAAVFRALVGSDLDDGLGFIRSCLWAPLLVHGRMIGLMSIVSQEPDAFGPSQTAMASAIGGQAAAAIENARLFEQAQGKAALEERQKLARELHDSVSQALFGIGLGARTAKTTLERDPAKAAAAVDYVLQLAAAGMAEMRALIFELRPESLEQEGLVAALEKQAAAVRARHGFTVEIALAAEPAIPVEAKEALYRIAQEALHNAVKHASASRVALELAEAEGELALTATDDGVGFDPRGAFPGHLGLVSMRERIQRFGGAVEIASAPGQGTRVRATLPLASQPAA
jgi:PAS domain S-box-containing protein